MSGSSHDNCVQTGTKERIVGRYGPAAIAAGSVHVALQSGEPPQRDGPPRKRKEQPNGGYRVVHYASRVPGPPYPP